MKFTKKLISVILAVVMIFGTASVAFASPIKNHSTLDTLITQDSIADIAEDMLKNINLRKNDITGTVLRLAFLFIKNDDLAGFINGRDVTKLSDEENAKILVDWLNKLLKDNTTTITEASWYGIAKLACKFLGIDLNLNDINGAIKTLHDACERCANPGLIGLAVDFADLGKLNGSALNGVSVSSKGNLGVVKALINWLSDNTYVIKQLIKGKLDAGTLNDTIKIDKINGKVNSLIGKDAILDKLYRLVYGGAKDGDFANSMYKDFNADQLVAAGFIKMMRNVNATDPKNFITQEDANKALGLNNFYEVIAEYVPVFLHSYKIKIEQSDSTIKEYSIIEFLNTNVRDIIVKLQSKLSEKIKDKDIDKAIKDELNTRFVFTPFTEDEFVNIFTAMKTEGVLAQINDVFCLFAKHILSDASYKKLALNEDGGNAVLNANLEKIFAFTLSGLSYVGKIYSYDFSAFTEEKVKEMTLSEMATEVLKLFFGDWFKDTFSAEAEKAVADAKTVGQLAVIAAKLTLANDKWIKFELTEPGKIDFSDIKDYNIDQCKDAILRMGAEAAALALEYNSKTTHFELSANRANWAYNDYLNAVVNWAVNFIAGIPAVVSEDTFFASQDAFYKINVILNELVDFSFVDAGFASFENFDIKTFLFDKLLGNLFDMNIEGILGTFKKNDKAANILNQKPIPGIISLLDRIVTAMFKHECDPTGRTTAKEILGTCKYRENKYEYCKHSGHYVGKGATNGTVKDNHDMKYLNVSDTVDCKQIKKCTKCGTPEYKNGKLQEKYIGSKHNFVVDPSKTIPATTTSNRFDVSVCTKCKLEKKTEVKGTMLTPTKVEIKANAHVKVKNDIVVIDTSVSKTALVGASNATKLVQANGKDTNTVATGTKLVIITNGKETASKVVALLGDVDGNGKVTVDDARAALRASVGLDALSAAQTLAADVDINNKVTVDDARAILRAAVGLDQSDSWIAKIK